MHGRKGKNQETFHVRKSLIQKHLRKETKGAEHSTNTSGDNSKIEGKIHPQLCNQQI